MSALNLIRDLKWHFEEKKDGNKVGASNCDVEDGDEDRVSLCDEYGMKGEEDSDEDGVSISENGDEDGVSFGEDDGDGNGVSFGDEDGVSFGDEDSDKDGVSFVDKIVMTME